MIHRRHPEDQNRLQGIYLCYVNACKPGKGNKQNIVYRMRNLFMDRWNLWPRLTFYRTWKDETRSTPKGLTIKPVCFYPGYQIWNSHPTLKKSEPITIKVSMRSSKSYTESLPKKRMGAGCLFFDEQRRILLVKPTYKHGWEIPGGVVELNESTKQCCRREINEELGLDRPVGEFLVVDYNQQTTEKTESLMFIFYGGILTSEEIQSIHLRVEELSEFRFFTDETFPPELPIPLRMRVLAAMSQAVKKQDIYLENQEAG